MQIIKETQGIVRQIFDFKTGELISQEFCALEGVEYAGMYDENDLVNETEEDLSYYDDAIYYEESIDLNDEELQKAYTFYAPFDMKQPGE